VYILSSKYGVLELLVKKDVAKKQIADEDAKRRAAAAAAAQSNTHIAAGVLADGTSQSGDNGIAEPVNVYDGTVSTAQHSTAVQPPAHPAPKNKRFFMSADLDTTRINRDVQKYVEEIIQHLTAVDGATVKVSLEVEAISNAGFCSRPCGQSPKTPGR